MNREKLAAAALADRRSFLRTASAAAGVALLAPHGWAAEPEAKPAPQTPVVRVERGTDVVLLGRSGIKTTVLGIGTGTKGGSEQRALGEEGFVKLAQYAYDRGIRYIDTADSYKMHAMVKAALKKLPRDEMFIQTKSFSRTAEKLAADIDRYRKELDIDVLDTLLIHCVTKDDWHLDMRPAIDVLLKAKQKKQVRAIGVSCHSYDALKSAVECEQIDVHLVRINPFKSHMDAEPEKVAAEIQKMHAKGRGVIGMKIFGEGAFSTRDKRLASLRYVLGLGTVHCFTIGFKTAEQIDETLTLIEEAVKPA